MRTVQVSPSGDARSSADAHPPPDHRGPDPPSGGPGPHTFPHRRLTPYAHHGMMTAQEKKPRGSPALPKVPKGEQPEAMTGACPECSRRIAKHPEHCRRIAKYPEHCRRIAKHPEPYEGRRGDHHPGIQHTSPPAAGPGVAGYSRHLSLGLSFHLR